MTVDTTFLPKTNGLVFSDRLVARSDKGRVFGAGTTYTPLQVATKALWVDGNVYEIGSTIAGYSATFTGGTPSTTYRSRAQYRRTEFDQWQNSNWFEHDNEVISVPVTIPIAGQIRFMTQAFQDVGSVRAIVDEAKSFASIRTVPFLEFGTITVTVNGIDYNYQEGTALTVLLNDPIPVVVTVAGNASPTYSWSSRGDNATFSDASAASTEVTCTDEGLVTVTCTLSDNNTEEIDTSVIIKFYSVDA